MNIEQKDQVNNLLSQIREIDLNEKVATTFSGITNLETQMLSQMIKEFTQQTAKHDDHLLFVESKRGYFEERVKYLDDLIGREVGASLFETFKQRKGELTHL